jgi:hypothetical protein
MHSRRFGVLAIAHCHPRLFSRLLCLEFEPRQPPVQKTSITQKTLGDAMPNASATNRRLPITIAIAATAVLTVTAADAASIDIGNTDLSLRWDTSLKYSTAARLKQADTVLLANPNNDDGDRNFGKGLISNRVDLFTEMDAVWMRRFGARISAAGYYDRVYNQSNDNPGFGGGAFPNQLSVPANEFTKASRDLHGRKAEVLDTFVFGKFDFGEANATVRAGRHSVLWGESLFFGINAIAGGQQPFDVVKLLSVPGTQFKEAIRPVPQISGQLQINSNVSVGAYVQTRWASSRTPAVGSYFSNTDPAVDGGESILLGPGVFAGRQGDREPKNSGQGGLQLRVRGEQTDFGFHAIRFHSKFPTLVPLIGLVQVGPAPTDVAPAPVGYYMAYPQGITALGASASRTFDIFNVAVEASVRHNQPLASSQGVDISAIAPVPATNVTDNPGYAVGRTAHVNLSTIGSLGPSLLWKEATLLAELAWNRTLSITRNEAAKDPNGTRDGTALRLLLEPTYRGVADGLDIGVPVGLGWAPKGSRPLGSGNPNAWIPEGGGDLSIGLNAAFRDTWRATLAYTHYFGDAGSFNTNTPNNAYSWKQTLRDRDFIAASLSYSF